MRLGLQGTAVISAHREAEVSGYEPETAEVVQAESVNEAGMVDQRMAGSGQNAGSSTVEESEQQQVKPEGEVEEQVKPCGCHRNSVTDMECKSDSDHVSVADSVFQNADLYPL